MVGKRRRRVRLHLEETGPDVALPSVEGVLIGYDHALREYRIGDPSLHWAAGAEPDQLKSDVLRIPRERVAFYEVIG